MDNIAIFYHVWQAHDWRTLFQQQIMSMHVSGLLAAADQIYVCCNGPESLPFDHPKFNIRRNTHYFMEGDTLREMWNFSKISRGYRVLYVHQKGLSYGSSLMRPQVDAWRLYLESCVIHRWQECVELLHTHDAVGTEWMPGPAIYLGPDQMVYALKNSGIFIGNFWWSNSEYIKLLDPDFLYKYDAAHQIEDIEIPKELAVMQNQQQIVRFNSELWIGTNDPKIYSFNRLHARFYDTNAMDRLEQWK